MDREITTNTVASDPKKANIGDILAAVSEAMDTPLAIGMLFGMPVTLVRSTGVLNICGTECTIDHPYIAGTPLCETAKKHMASR